MPSDSAELALQAVGPHRQPFDEALARTIEEVRAYLSAREAPEEGTAARVAAELGPFGAGQIDAGRLAELLEEDTEPLDMLTANRIRLELATLSAIRGLGDDLALVRVPEGGSLREALHAAFVRAGKAFLAARSVAEVRHGNAGHGDSREALAFGQWSRAERGIAPPLVVELSGADVFAGGVAEFLDGAVHIVLLVTGPAPPAPLARLVTPGVFVLQTTDPAELMRMSVFEGPGIAALLPEGCACFVHDPTRGGTAASRLQVSFMPDEAPRKSVGAMTPFQQEQELELLRALTTCVGVGVGLGVGVGVGVGSSSADGAGASGGATGALGTDREDRAGSATGADGASPQGTGAPAPARAPQPADQLAAWLLSQADLTR